MKRERPNGFPHGRTLPIMARPSCGRKNFWALQPERVEVWSEKGTVRGTLAPVLRQYAVTFRVMHGFGSATTAHDVAEETGGLKKPLRALYVGDYDPSGLYMSEVDLPGRMERNAGNVDIKRLALTRMAGSSRIMARCAGSLTP